MAFLFEKLDVYQKAVDFAESIDRLCFNIPKGKYFLTNQLRRASLSISLNIAEGNGRWHNADKRQFFTIARGSACECIPILELLQRNSAISKKTHDQLKAEIDRLCQMITGLIKKTIIDNRKSTEWIHLQIERFISRFSIFHSRATLCIAGVIG